ncbi:hypothetical protein BX666DRAFT_1667148 [Dichotomocladium elegans]|nr:hypothetical protein BX666DRAFT_1667148 [Dichotomocladium elegans]
MVRAHNPPDYDEPPPSYDESQNTAYNPIFVSSTAHSGDQNNAIITGPPQPSFLSTFADGRQPASSINVTTDRPAPSTGLYPDIERQQHQPSRPLISGGYYQTIHIPQQQGHYADEFERYHRRRFRRRRMIDPSERRFPIAALFFLFGWFCPPLWVLGACCCSGRRNHYESWWGKANFAMAVMFIISSVAYSTIALTLGDWMIGLRLFNVSTA